MQDCELAEDPGLARLAYVSPESTLCTEHMLDEVLDVEETLLTFRDNDLDLEQEPLQLLPLPLMVCNTNKSPATHICRIEKGRLSLLKTRANHSVA